MMLVGTPRMSTVPRTPTALVKKPARTPPPKPPMKKMYIVAHRGAHAAQAVRDTPPAAPA